MWVEWWKREEWIIKNHLNLTTEFWAFDVIPILGLKSIEAFLICIMQEGLSTITDLLEWFLLVHTLVIQKNN